MRELNNYTYEFGAFRFEPGERRLLREGQPVLLTPKAFDTLAVLVERAGRLVEKEELMNVLWPDSFVEEANLTQQVSTLRKALGETVSGGSFIETVPKKGFRFVAEVIKHSRDSRAPTAERKSNPQLESVAAAQLAEPQSEVGAPSLAPPRLKGFLAGRRILIGLLALAALASLVGFGLSRRRSETALAPPKTIAVLPFKPLSADSRNESLEMGMAETLITRLSNTNQILVQPMSAVRKYTDAHQDAVKIGQELQTDTILDGSIQKVGDRLRVTVRLTDIRNGMPLWAQQFDENFTDIFKVQDSISEKIANTLRVKLSGSGRESLTKHYTDSPEAYELYLQAQYLWDNRTEENRQKMLSYYQQALEKDPKFALAHVGIAECQMGLVGSNKATAKDILPSVRESLTKASQLDDSLAEARNLMAEVKYQFDYDWVGAEEEFKRAIDLNGNVSSMRLAYSTYLMCVGRFDEAMREMEIARQLDPHSRVINRQKGRLLYFSRQYDRAIQHYRHILEAEPNLAINHWTLSRVYEQKGMYAEAVEEELRAARIDGTLVTPQEIEADKEVFRVSGWQSYQQKRCERMVRRGQELNASPVTIARSFVRLGNNDEAFAWLEKAIDARATGVWGLKVDPTFDSLRSDPRFAKLLRQMNLSP
jgi:DNA-binding winged helix-turn-helix (wHTH) protein/TolB-like protein